MAVRIVIKPTGPKATSEAIEAWKASAQKLADENQAEVELKGWSPDGTTIVSHLIATPAKRGLRGRIRG